MEYPALKRNALSSCEDTGNLKHVLLSERGLSEKATNYMISTVWHLGNDKLMVTVKRWEVARGYEGWLGREQDFQAAKLLCIWYYNGKYMPYTLVQTHRMYKS